MRMSLRALIFIGFIWVLAGSTAYAADALTWRHAPHGGNIEIIFNAHTGLDRLEVVVKDTTVSRERSFSRENLREGDEWSVRVPAPRQPSNIRVEFTLWVDGQSYPGVYEFPASPVSKLDYRLESSRFDDTYNELQIIPDEKVVRARVIARGEDGAVIQQFTRDIEGAANATMPLIFETPARVLNVDVMLTSEGGATREYRYIPWSFETETRGLRFQTGSAAIEAEDEEVLRAVYEELHTAIEAVGAHVDLELYVGGYTDTVGGASSNLSLSTQRAAAIANHLKQQGVDIPIYVQGFGERALAVPTEDNVEEPANRRAVFIVRVGKPPTDANFPTSDWRRLR